MSFVFLILAILMLIAKHPILAIIFGLIALFSRKRKS